MVATVRPNAETAIVLVARYILSFSNYSVRFAGVREALHTVGAYVSSFRNSSVRVRPPFFRDATPRVLHSLILRSENK